MDEVVPPSSPNQKVEGGFLVNKMKKITLTPLGIIRTPFNDLEEVPYQAHASKTRGTVKIFKKYRDGLKGIERSSYIELYFYFHKAQSYSLQLIPHGRKTKRGVFATRSPHRPNFIGNSTVKLVERAGNKLQVKGIDVIDKTPLLDIKPYDPQLYTVHHDKG